MRSGKQNIELKCIVCAVIWNTIHMQKIVDQIRAAGQTVQDEDLARNWPLLHAHIIPDGILLELLKLKAPLTLRSIC
jgi:hypothetical protein